MANTPYYTKAESDAKSVTLKSELLSEVTEIIPDVPEIIHTGRVFEPVITPDQEPLDGTGSHGIDARTITVAELYSLWDNLIAEYPDYLSTENIGLDQSGTYQLRKIKFKIPKGSYSSQYYENVQPTYRRVFITANIHGYSSDGDSKDNSIILYSFIKDLLDPEQWRNRQELMFIRQNYEFVIIPCANPWGYDNDNRRNSRNVDLNRNFDYNWSPNNDNAGSSAFSEAESQIIANEITAENNLSKLDFIMDMHSIGQGWPGMLYGRGQLGVETAANVMAFMREVFERPETYATETTNDPGPVGWSVGKLGVPFGFVPEFAYKGMSGGGHFVAKAMTFNYNMLTLIFMMK